MIFYADLPEYVREACDCNLTPSKITRLVTRSSVENGKAWNFLGDRFAYCKWIGLEMAAVIDDEVWQKEAERISSLSQKSPDEVSRIGFEISKKAANCFYNGMVFDLKSFCELWEVRSRFPIVLYDVFPKPTFGRPRISEDYLELAARLCGRNYRRMIDWYKLGTLAEANRPIVNDVTKKLLKKYVGGGKKDYYLSIFHHHNTEADFFVGLSRPEPLGDYEHYSNSGDDPRIIARAGFRLLDPEIISIENLQGVQKFRRTPDFSQTPIKDIITGNSELREIGWRSLLIKTIEHIAFEMGIKMIMFRPAESLMHKYGASQKVDIEKRYNGTALQNNYEPAVDTNNNKVYVKYFIDAHNIELTLPAHRHTN